MGMSLEKVKSLLEDVLNDYGMPRAIRAKIEESLKTIDNKDEINVKIASIISALDDVSSDPNISSYARTRMWNLLSELESLKE